MSSVDYGTESRMLIPSLSVGELMFAELSLKLPEFCGNRIFISVFLSSRHRTGFWTVECEPKVLTSVYVNFISIQETFKGISWD